MTNLSHHEAIHKGFKKWQLPFYFSKPALSHFKHMIDGVFSKGFAGKLTDIHTLSHYAKHRTTLGHFLAKGTWKESYLLQISQRYVHKMIDATKPVFFLLDDTISQKTQPLSQAKSPIESCGFHFSHTEGKPVWGHQVVQMMVKSGNQAYPYEHQLYEKDQTESKIALSLKMIDQLPIENQPSYLLCDSWYTSRSIVEASLSKGIHLIGALKTNRIIYPMGIRTQAKDFASHIRKEDTDVVTVGHESYRVYRYEGALNDIPYGVVLLSWKVGDPMDSSHMRCFLSTDTALPSAKILQYYQERWSIETYFKQIKQTMGFNKYQIRKTRAIKRFWIIIQFAYLFVMCFEKGHFRDAVRAFRKKKVDSVIEFVYHQTTAGTSLEQIKKHLHVA